MEEKEVQEIKKPGLKFSPLNVLVALSIAAAVYFAGLSTGNDMQRSFNGLFMGLSVLAALVFFIADLIFRRIFPSLKKLWLVELSFIGFAAVMTLIIKIVILN